MPEQIKNGEYFRCSRNTLLGKDFMSCHVSDFKVTHHVMPYLGVLMNQKSHELAHN